MAGKIKRQIDALVAERAKGNETLARVIRTKLILKGIDPEKYSAHSADEPEILRKLEKMLRNTDT